MKTLIDPAIHTYRQIESKLWLLNHCNIVNDGCGLVVKLFGLQPILDTSSVFGWANDVRPMYVSINRFMQPHKQ